jgi:hypothetical protein
MRSVAAVVLALVGSFIAVVWKHLSSELIGRRTGER